MNTLDDELRQIDAQPRKHLTDHEIDRAEALLRTVMSQAQPPAAASVPRWRGPARRVWWTAGVALSAGGALVGAAVIGAPALRALHHDLPGESGSRMTTADLMSWNAVPAHPASSSSPVQRTAEACAAESHSAVEHIGLVDQRGTIMTLVVTTTTGDRRWCFGRDGQLITEELLDTSDAHLSTPAAGGVFLETAGEQGTPAVASALGEVGPDVTDVVLRTAGGRSITTTVDDGLWSAWWPVEDETADSSSTITITWRTADGVQHSMTAAEAADARP